MDETRYIRGRRAVFERNLIEVLGRLADLSVAHPAYEAAAAKHPDKRICLRQTCRMIRGSDRDR
jgi:hypothetical protein